MPKILTIIIPVYNMEKYLSRCLDSVVNSKYINEIQMLVINDGSKDNSLNIAKAYAVKYPESVEVVDKPNGGWGTAVNLGLSLAKGKYLKLLDSDDWFDTEQFDKLIDFLRDCNADIIASPYEKIYDGMPNEKFEYDQEIIGEHDLMSRMKELDFVPDIPMATLCYRTSLLKEMGLTVNDRYYADVQFALMPLAFARSIVYTPYNIYRYYLGRPDHSTGTQGYITHYKDYFDLTMSLVNFYMSNNLNGDSRTLMQREIGRHIRFCHYMTFSRTYLAGADDAVRNLKKFSAELKKKSPELYRQAAKAKVRGIPFIAIWRAFGVNILNLRKWI